MINQVKKLLLVLLFQSFFFIFAVAQNNQANTDLQQAENLNRQSGRLYALRQYDTALELSLKELALREKIGDEQFIAAVHFNVGGIYRQKGNLEEAVKYFEVALVHYRRAFGGNHPKIFNALNQLAHVLILKDDKTKAIETLKNAQLIAEQIYGKESQQVAEQYFAQAQVFSLMNKYKESNNAYQTVILLNDKILKSTSDDNRPDVDDYMCFLVRNYRFDEKWDDFNDKREQAKKDNYLQSGIVYGKAVKIVKPDLPPRKGTLNRTTKIIVRVMIDENGDIVRAKAVCSGNATFTEASLKAAYKSKFTPTLKNGVPIKRIGLIIYNIEE